jgi:hypothetical protein
MMMLNERGDGGDDDNNVIAVVAGENVVRADAVHFVAESPRLGSQ